MTSKIFSFIAVIVAVVLGLKWFKNGSLDLSGWITTKNGSSSVYPSGNRILATLVQLPDGNRWTCPIGYKLSRVPASLTEKETWWCEKVDVGTSNTGSGAGTSKATTCPMVRRNSCGGAQIGIPTVPGSWNSVTGKCDYPVQTPCPPSPVRYSGNNKGRYLPS